MGSGTRELRPLIKSRATRRRRFALPGVALLLLLGIVASGGAFAATGAARGQSAKLLEALLPEASRAEREKALAQLRTTPDRRFIAPLIDLLRFADAPEPYGDESVSILETLRRLTVRASSISGSRWPR